MVLWFVDVKPMLMVLVCWCNVNGIGFVDVKPMLMVLGLLM